MTTAIARDSVPAGPVRTDEGRWRPTRAGLLNVWQYTDEVLQFEQGRLVLYGPNGSGKTMALELLLPHLLDAKGQPGRLSTSGAERGGLWERVSGYDEGEPRTGYLWIEFGRPTGEAFTAGVRLRAKPSGGGDKHWFTTTRRVGVDFALLDEHRRPLSVEQLSAAIEPEGKVWGGDTGGYRQAVRAALFAGWPEDRLDALIRTLLVVRKQNVTDGLSSAKLSELLSEALPPLDDHEIGRVADGFADLDRRRDHIAQLETDVLAVRRMGDANRVYARAFTARVVGEVVSATTAFDNVTRDVRRLQGELSDCEQRVAELVRREETLELEERRIEARLDGLKSSEAYTYGAELEGLRQAAQGAAQRAGEAEAEANATRGRAQTKREQASTARRALELAAEQARGARQELATAATALGAAMLDEVADDALVGASFTFVEGRVQAVREVRAALGVLGGAIVRRDVTQESNARCEAELTRLEEQLLSATRAADEAQRRFRAAVAAWRAEARELSPYVELLEDWEAAPAIVAEARARAQEPLITSRSRVAQGRAALQAQLQELRHERESWLAGKEPEPETPPGRRDRAGLAGAPLWRLVQFREHASEAARGAIESALADARLLDAWVSRDGRVALGADDADVLLIERATGPALEHALTLASLLEPDPATDAVEPQAVARLLASVALVARDAHAAQLTEEGVLIGADGSWRTPRLAGRASLGPARYLGVSSRDATRKARIAALSREIAEREAEDGALRIEHDLLEARIRRCEQEQQVFPATAELLAANRAVDTNRVRVDSARDGLAQAAAALLAAIERVKQEQRELQRVASRHELPTEPAKLEDIERRLGQLRRSVFAFQEHQQRCESARRNADRADADATHAESEAVRRADTARARRGEHAEAHSRLEAIDAAVGADYREVLDAIRLATGRRAEIGGEQKDVRTRGREATEWKGRAATALAQAEERRAAAEAQRAHSGESLVRLCQDGLVVDAEVESPPAADTLTSITAILDAARRIRSSAGLPASPEDADLVRQSNTVMARVGDASRQLAGRADLTFETNDRGGWSVLRAHHEGVVVGARGLLASLRDDLDSAQAELSQRQQELFEQILSGSVREHLKERLWGAQALVDRVDELLGQARTEAGGVRVSLQWEIDPDQSEAAELRQAKQLLLHDSPVAHGRAELDAFLKARIERVRSAQDDTGEWRDRLARVLDYRSWHRFRVLVHHNRFGQQPRPLDSKKVSLSTGEKTMVMILPLLAAVTAHYEPAPGDPPCSTPRLLLMDELFPKLDFPNKRKLMGLLPKLDLDAVFTSDKDRCEYDTLDGIAIHVFQKLGDDKTTTTRLVWNGVATRVTPEFA